jgi:hypothetical protein
VIDNDYDRRRAFMRSTEKERFEKLYDMHMTMVRALDAQALIRMKDDIEYLKRELAGVSRRKDETLTTYEKINAEMNKRNSGLRWYVDKVLPSTLAAIQTLIVMAVLYMAFGGKLP